MPQDWYYLRAGQQTGPVSDDILRAMVERGEIHAGDLVWREGMAGWTSAGQALGIGGGSRRNGLGLASFVLALVSGLIEFGFVVAAGVIEASQPGGVDAESPTAVVIGLGVLGGLLLTLAGFCLGIGSFFLPNRDRLFGSLGVALNGVILLGVVALLVIGMAAAG
jgi:hypothetical protein